MNILDASDVGRLVRQRRRELNLSQEELAERSGVTRQWLVRFEQGNSEVALSRAFAVLRQLGLSIRVNPQNERDSAPSVTVPLVIPKVDMSRFTEGPSKSIARNLVTPERLEQVRRHIDQLDQRDRDG